MLAADPWGACAHPRQAAYSIWRTGAVRPTITSGRFGAARPLPPTPHGTATWASSDGMVQSPCGRPDCGRATHHGESDTVAQRIRQSLQQTPSRSPRNAQTHPRQHRMNGTDRLTTACPAQTPPHWHTHNRPPKRGQLRRQLRQARCAPPSGPEEHAVSNVIADHSNVCAIRPDATLYC